MSLLSGHRVAVLDVETTGWNPAEDAIVEIAGVTLQDGIRTSEWSTLVAPGRPVPESATRIHGIDDRMLAGAPTPETAARTVRTNCEGHVLAVHNARFDIPFVNALLRRTGLPPLLAPVIDTLGLARGLFGTGNNSLGALAAKLGLPREPAHRALGDALTTARLFLHLAGRWQQEKGVASLAELAAASQDVVRLTARR